MIEDKGYKMYEDIKFFSRDVYEFIITRCNKELKEGRYEFQDGCYANVESYTTYKRSDRRFENHQKYIDLQMILFGEEIIEVCDSRLLQIMDQYNADQDVSFYRNDYVGKKNILKSGEYIFIFPGQAHMPCLLNQHPCTVKKIVFKIPAERFHGLLFMDVDGTLTDGKIYMSDSGELMKAFNIKDGYGIRDLLPQHGIVPVIITARESQIVSNRCRELEIYEVLQNCSEKKQGMIDVSFRYGIYPDENGILKNTMYIGDDITDLSGMQLAEKSGCPIDAVNEVRELVNYICSTKGGDGAVREFIEWIIHSETKS